MPSEKEEGFNVFHLYLLVKIFLPLVNHDPLLALKVQSPCLFPVHFRRQKGYVTIYPFVGAFPLILGGASAYEVYCPPLELVSILVSQCTGIWHAGRLPNDFIRRKLTTESIFKPVLRESNR